MLLSIVNYVNDNVNDDIINNINYKFLIILLTMLAKC